MTIDHQTQLRVHIRWMIRRDMAEVLEIERGASSSPGSKRNSSAACGNAIASAWWPSTASASSAS